MPDKKYLIEIPDMPEGSGIWEADKWERNKDAFMKENPTAKVFEMGAYDAEDTNENDQIFISMDDEESSGVWDSDKWERNKDAFMQENPTAQISRVRYQDYWGDRASAIENRLAELDQPDQERAARLAEIGYFDDSENEANLDINLKPVSQAMKVNSVSGDVEYLDPAVEEFFANDDAYTQKQLEKNQLKAEYETNPSVIAQREWEAKRKEAEKAYRGELKQQITEDYDANVDKNKAARGGIEIDGVPVYGPASFEAEKQDKYLAALQLLDFADRMEKGEKFWEGVGYGATKAAVDYDGKEMQQVGLVFKKLEDRGVNINEATEEQIDEALDPEDKALMLSYLEYQKAMYEADPSRAFKGGAQFGETIPFILEFVATGDIYKAGAKKTMELAGKKAIGKGFAKWIAKSAGKKLPTLMKQGVAKATSGTIKALGGTLTRTVAQPTTYVKMATPDIQISEQGDVFVETHATREFFDHYIENLSEISGEGMVAGLGGAAKLLNSTKIGKMPFMKLGEWLGNKAVWQGLSKLGAQSLPIEVAEEVVGNALRYVTGVDKDALGRMFEKDEFASMLIGFAPLTVLGIGTSAAAMGAVNIGAATAQTKMRDALNPYYTEQQIDEVTGALERAKTSDEVVEALKPILVGMHDATQEEKTAVMDYAIKVAKKKAMISARNFQEMQLSDAAIRQVEDKVGRFWIENEDKSRTVRQVNLNDGRQVFVVSQPNEAGEVATVEVDTGKKGMAKLSDVKEEIFNSSLESYGTRFVMADRKAKEQERMANERQVQINLVRQNLAAQKGKINLGTEGAPIMVVADAETEAGVRYVAENGSTGNLSWEAVADAMGTPIIVKTDAQLAQEEAAAIVARDAERRAARAQLDAVGTEEVTEAAEEVENAANQLDEVHIPKNEDGSVNEAAFWEQNPEAYVQWNDEQQQDGGVDSLEQITNAKNELTSLLAEAQTAQQTSDPMQRKAAKAEVQRLSEKINTLTALEQKYVEALKTPEQKRKDVEEGIKTRAKEWSDKTGVEINVVENLSQVKNAEARAAMAAGQKVFAWTEGGKAYMYLPAIESVEQLDEKFAHEAVAHIGLRSFLGEGYDALLDRVWNSMSDTAKRRYANYGTVRGDQRSAADEYLAHIAEKMGADVASMQEFNEEEKSVWQSIVDFVKEAFGKIFGNSATISEEEITDLIRSSYQNLAQQTAATDEATEQQRSAINSLMDALTPEEAVEVAENDYQIASDALKELMANQPKVEKGESSASYIERKKAYNDSLREAQAKADAARAIADEVKRMIAPVPAQVSEVQPETEQAPAVEVIADQVDSTEPRIIKNVDGAAVAETDGNGSTMLSVSSYEDGGREYLVNWLAKEQYMGQEEKDFIITTLDQQYELAKQLGKEFPVFGAWSSAEVEVDGNGNPIMSVIKANGDYSMNLDFSLICKKRRPLNALLDIMIADRMLDMRSLDEGEIAKINKVIQRYGFEVACALCFVDSKRYRVVKVANDFADIYNNLVNSLIPAGSGIEAMEYNYAGYDYINERNKARTGMHLDEVKTSELDWTKVNEVLKGVKTARTVEQKIAKMLKSNPQSRRLVNATDFVTNLGFEAVKKNNPELLKLYNAKKGTGGPKASFGDVQYLNDILKNKSFTPAKAYAVGGVRIQSFSDYMGHMFFDYMQMMAELAAKGLPAHAYTKEEAFARIFGMTGVKINLSLVPAVAKDGIAPGLDAEGNYVWAVPYTDENGNEIQGQTFPPEVAFEMQRDPRYSGNVGAIAVGISDEHILKMLDDENIHFIIPYHKSSLSPIVAKETNIDQFKDYTSTQNTKLVSNEENDALSPKQKAAILKKNSFDFYESLARTKDPKATAQEYLDHCKKHGFVPKFEQFSEHENYYKLLVDFNTYDFITGEYAPQGPVKMTFPEELEQLVKASVASNEELEADLKDKVGRMAQSVKEELGRTMFSVEPRTEEQREQLFAAAKKEFGTTNNFNVAGFMLPDGSLLDFSEEGAPANQRTLDHREIEGVIMDEGREYDNRWQYLADFMNEGAIRLLPEYAGINLMHAPTAEQRKRLFDFIYKYNGEVILEIADDRLNNVAYVEYDRRTSPSRIFRDIDGYFQNGIAPQQNTMFSVVTPEVREEMDRIAANAIIDGNYMFAPNGQPTKLTADQWAMVRTENFTNWFGDWINDPENASKILDENGEPMVMYHGSAWEPLLEPKGEAVFRMNDGLLGKGAYFSNNLTEATAYAEIATDLDMTEEGNYELLQDKYVTDYFLNIRNEEDIYRQGGDIIAVAKSPNQIKSATDNNGEFSESSDIRFSVQEEGQSSEDFHNAVLDDFKKLFNVIAPTTVVRVEDKEAVARALGIEQDELFNRLYEAIVEGVSRGGSSLYLENTKRIAIFAKDDQNTSADVDDSIFHENTHALVTDNPELLELGQWLWDNASKGARLRVKESILDEGYPEWQQSNEMLARFAGSMLAIGRAGEVLNMLPADQKKHWEFILNAFGYEPERDDRRRLQRFDSDAARARVSAAQSQQTLSDNGTSARYSAEERRVINELFPGAIKEEPRTAPSKDEVPEIIDDLFEQADSSKNKVQRKIISSVTPRQLEEYRKKGILNVTADFVHSIENTALRHENKRHSGDNRTQQPLTKEEWHNILDVIENFDTVEKQKSKSGLDVIVYKKKNNDGTIYYVEEIRTGRKSLALTTAYKKRGDSSELMADALPQTSETTLDNTSFDSKDSDNSENSNTLFSLDTETEIKAIKGLSILDSMNISLEQEIVITREAIDAARKRIAELNKRLGDKTQPVLKKQIENAENSLKTYLRQMEILQDVEDKLIKVEFVEPDVRTQMANMEPQNAFEYLSELLTMHLTPVVQTKVVDADGKETIVRQGGKKKGVMLTPETLEKELGYSKSDWKGISYIVSESDGMSLDAIAEMIEQDFDASHIFGSMNTLEIKDVIIDFLQSMSSYTEIRDYIKNERERMAKEEADEINGRIQQAIEEIDSQFGMSIDEYNAMLIQEERGARERWLEENENPERFAKFEQSNIEDNGQTSGKAGEASEAAPGANGEGSEGGQASEGSGDVAGSGKNVENPADGGQEAGAGNNQGNGNGGENNTGDQGGNTATGVVPGNVESGKQSVDEIVESGKQKVLQQNADAADTLMDRIRAINGNLQQLRMMAAAQREYDKKTVKVITDLANELLTNGALSDMTRGEIKRLLSVIKDATGKSDLTVSVDRLMDIMIGNQLRYGKNRFEEYLKIRGKKVDARGVEVRGALDVEGQQVMDAVREGITLDMDRIQDRISAAEDKLFDTSKTISRNAEHELAGLEIARQYIENVKESESEEKDLRKELKDAKEQYEAGNMDKTSYKEFVKATHDAIRENRMQRVMAYESLLSEMADMIKNSILKAGQLREAEKARVERIQHFANSDMQGMPADEHQTKTNEFWNNPIVRFLLKPLATFDQMLRHFAPKSRSGEGYLWNHFMGGWLRATENEYKGIQAAHDKLDAKVRSVFGNSAKKWSDLFAIERKLPKAEISFWDAGEIKKFEVTQGNLLYIYMVNKMTDGKMKLRKMGISEEDVADMTRELDPRFVELADWLQEDFLPGLREKYNEVHERLFGAPMAAIDNYFPIRVLANARTREVDVNIEESNAKPSTITGNIMKRTRNSLALDILGSDAFDVILGHIEDMEKWAAFSEWNKDLNTLLSYKKFRNRVQNMSGIYGAGSVVWNNFRSVAEIAAGVYKPATKADSVDKTIMNIAKGVTGAKISFRVYTAFKQLLSWPAFISDANPVILAKNMVNPVKAWNWAMDNLPLFEKRWKSRQAGDSRLMQTDADWKLWKNKAVEIAGRLGMTPNALVDAVTVAIGARSVYETRVKQYLDYGYDQEKAEEKAKRDATVAFNESQQSNESAFLSQIQMDRTVASVVLTVFRNSSMGYQRMYVDALRNITRMTKKGYKTESIEYMKKQMLRDGLAEADADRAANRIYNRSFVKNAVQALTFGFIVQLAWNLGPYLPYIFGGDDDDKKKEMATDAAVRALVGGPVEGMSGGSVLSNVLGNIAMGEKLSEVNGVQLPLSSDVENLFKLFGKDNVRAVNEIFNIVIQSGIGVNPQTITDAVVAIVDACNGDLGTATEAALCLMRILQVPQSQLEDLYLDEIDFSADDALDLTIREFAERYAKYKVSRSAPLTKWMYTDEKEKEREETFIKRFTSEAEELKRTRGNEEAKAFYQYYDNEYADVAESLRDLKRRAKDAEGAEVKAISKEADEFVKTEEFKRYDDLVGDIKAYEAYKKLLKDVTDPETRKEYEKEMLKHRRNVVNKINGYETEIE